MQQFHFQNEEVLKTERVTDLEARQIVHLWAENQKQAATSAGPTVHDIAEGLEIPPEEALRLLDQVRQKQVVHVEQKVQTRRRSVQPSPPTSIPVQEVRTEPSRPEPVPGPASAGATIPATPAPSSNSGP
jgi:DNA-directed RNA polymerase specialized sigma subunit